MNRIAVIFLSLGFILYSGEIRAQSFATGTSLTEKTSGGAQFRQNEANRQLETDNRPKTEDDILVDSVERNFGAEVRENKQEKQYDNTFGKISHMKVVDGKMVLDDKRYILVYYDNYKVERGLDGITRCSMRIYVLNDLTERISNLGLKLKWPEISTNVQMQRVNPGVKTYMDVMLLGDGCLSMDKAPTIEVNRCRVKGMNEDKCADAIRWFKKNQ